MRALTRYLVWMVLFCAGVAAGQEGKPLPPGVRQGERLPYPAGEPRKVTARGERRSPGPAQLTRDAEELAKLAGLIPDQVDQVARGQFPKDLPEQLKRIEKLSKQLRRELSR